jgi:hypothetical protein
VIIWFPVDQIIVSSGKVDIDVTVTKALFQSREINFSSYFLATFSHL